MPQITVSSEVQDSNEVPVLAKRVSEFFREIVRILNGRLAFQENIKGKFYTIDFKTASVETVLKHDLGFEPTGFFLVRRYNSTISVYDSSRPWTTDKAFFKATAVGKAKLYLF